MDKEFPSVLLHYDQEQDAKLAGYMKHASQGFKPSKESSLKAALQLSYVLYAYRRHDDIASISTYLDSVLAEIPKTHQWCVYYIFSLHSRRRTLTRQVKVEER